MPTESKPSKSSHFEDLKKDDKGGLTVKDYAIGQKHVDFSSARPPPPPPPPQKPRAPDAHKQEVKEEEDNEDVFEYLKAKKKQEEVRETNEEDKEDEENIKMARKATVRAKKNTSHICKSFHPPR